MNVHTYTTVEICVIQRIKNNNNTAADNLVKFECRKIYNFSTIFNGDTVPMVYIVLYTVLNGKRQRKQRATETEQKTKPVNFAVF